MAPNPPTEPGWYPDPWGTGEERHFDGTAWATTTRPVGGGVAPDGAPAGARAVVGTGDGPSGDAPVAAWYPDPAGTDALRWWDGRAWTDHLASPNPPGRVAIPQTRGGTPAEAEAVRVRANGLGRAAGALLLVAGPARAAQIVVTSIALHRVSGAFREMLDNPDRRVDLTTSTSPWLSLVSNLSTLVLLATGIVFILWLGNAGKHAWLRGLPLKRPAWLGAWSFVIPVVRFWFPYRAARDLFPAEHPGHALVARWWALWIAMTLLQTAAFLAALFAAPDPLTVVLVTLGALTALLAAGAGRIVIGAVESAHRVLAGVSLQSE